MLPRSLLPLPLVGLGPVLLKNVEVNNFDASPSGSGIRNPKHLATKPPVAYPGREGYTHVSNLDHITAPGTTGGAIVPRSNSTGTRVQKTGCALHLVAITQACVERIPREHENR